MEGGLPENMFCKLLDGILAWLMLRMLLQSGSTVLPEQSCPPLTVRMELGKDTSNVKWVHPDVLK